MSHEVKMRWQDLDALGHVNHPVVLTYFEEGRDAFLAARGIGRDEYVVGRCSVEFKREIDPDLGSVTVECEIDRLGTKSISTVERILGADGVALAEAQFGLVLWDPDRRISRPISEKERVALS